MSTVCDPKQNYLLAAIPDNEFERIAPYLEWVSLKHGEVVYEFYACGWFFFCSGVPSIRSRGCCMVSAICQGGAEPSLAWPA